MAGRKKSAIRRVTDKLAVVANAVKLILTFPRFEEAVIAILLLLIVCRGLINITYGAIAG